MRHQRTLSIREAADTVTGPPVRLNEATELLVDLIDAGGGVARYARLSLLGTDGNHEIYNRNAAAPLRLRVSVSQTRWPGGEIVQDVLAFVDLPPFI